MDEHAVFRVAVEIIVAGVVWIAATAAWAPAAVCVGGAALLGTAVGWWRLGRPAARANPPPPLLPQMSVRGKSLLLSAAGGFVMAILLGVQDGDAAHGWAIVFGVLAVVQVVRAYRER